MRTIVIGITGASSSGKSTIALLLQKIFRQSEIIHEDDFFKPEKEIPLDIERGDRDWDCPEAVDLDALKQTLKVLKGKGEPSKNLKARVARNGDHYEFSHKSTEPPHNDTNFNVDHEVVKSFQNDILLQRKDVKLYFLDGFLLLNDRDLVQLLDFTLFFKTDYNTLKLRRQRRIYTVEGNEWKDPPGYFDTFVWPGYYKHHRSLFLDGNNECAVKNTGGMLSLEFKTKYRVYEFQNDDDTDSKLLLERVVNIIVENIRLLI
ncbi:hypothetical protein CANINC_002527 [Pichia inconspicua]|uniref:Phosphoribulokinase/uridine kinase domain-containing protein n=1 Tax=Pichia inconspicua TaxID=52247 RepID=A0A4T0X0W2_9ASCO|nr:hypothetical protein CANINC_002527 [[Candida] inconspicua]